MAVDADDAGDGLGHLDRALGDALLGVEIVYDHLHDAGVAASIQTHLVVCALVGQDGLETLLGAQFRSLQAVAYRLWVSARNKDDLRTQLG